MQLLDFQQTDGKIIYINPLQIGVIQEAYNNTTYLTVGGFGVSLQSSVGEINRRVNESLSTIFHVS